jgi:hypothetical protein
MASLTGNKIKDTYKGLIKTTDNAELGATAKELTDGNGNGSGVTLDNAGNVTATSFTGDGSGLTNLPSGAVSSVNTQTGDVVLDTDDIAEGSNEYYTDAKVEANSAVVANTAKVGITPTQASEIAANTLKTGITTQQANDIVANNAKVTRRPITAGGNTLETSESLTLTAGSNVTITEASGTVTIASTGGAGSIDLGTSKTTTSVTVTNSGGTDATISEASSSAAGVMSTAHHDKLDGIAAGAEVNPTNTDGLTEGSSNLYYTEARVSANTDVVANTAKISFDSASSTKLSGIEEGAEVNTVDSVNGATGAVSLDTSDLTDVAATAPTNGQVLQYNSTSSNYEPVTLSSTAPVDSVNSQTGAVVLDADDISDAATTNKFTTATNLTKLGNISVTQAVDLDTMESDIATNNAKNTYPSADATKVGHISVTQAVDLDTMESNIATNNAKNSYPSADATKVGHISVTQAVDLDTIESDVATNNGKVSMVLGTTAGTALEGDTALLQLGTTSTTALAGDTTTISAQQASDITTNNAKVGITTQQASDITTNNAKVGITTQQAADISTNNSKVSMVLGTTAGTALEGDTPLLQLGTTSTTALAGDTVIPTNNNQLTNGASYITASSTDTLTNKSGSNSQWTNDENYITGNETVTLSGDITGSGTTAITASIANNVVGADELNVSGNGTSGQVLASDGDGTFSWADAGGSYTPNIVSGATTASKDNLYIFTASATLTLPASPSGGDSIKVSNLSGTTTCVIARNTNNIMAVGEDMTLDNQYASFELIYGDATRGWVVVGGN